MSNYNGQFVMDAPNNTWNKVFDMVRPSSIVLDVGCSNGNFGKALIENKGCIVDGIEIDKEDARIASTKLRSVYVGFIEDAIKGSFKDKKYDFITFLDVIEHLYDPVQTLKSIRKNLDNKGAILFSIPNMAHVSVRLMIMSGRFEYGNTGLLDNTHLHFYTKQEIERVFNDAGFNITNWDFTEAIYTEDLLRKELKKLGIKNSTPDLIKLLNSSDSRIFQYIGKAKPTRIIPSVRPHYSPNPQGVITNWYEKREKELLEEINRNVEQIKILQQENNNPINMKSEKEKTEPNEILKRISPKYLIKHIIKKSIKK